MYASWTEVEATGRVMADNGRVYVTFNGNQYTVWKAVGRGYKCLDIYPDVKLDPREVADSLLVRYWNA